MPERSSRLCVSTFVVWALSPWVLSMAMAAPLPIQLDDELSRFIAGRELVFVARELDGDPTYALSPARIDVRHPPFSTFKIPNFLIALETGVIADPGAFREWDPALRPASDFWPESWMRSQSLETAFRRSAVWFFRDIALEVGGEQYRQDLVRFEYGNRAAPDGNDAFWLDGTLQISPLEQVTFLAGLLEGGYSIDSRHMDALRAVSLLEDSGDCRLHGKTGAGSAGEDFGGPFEGWLVGWSQCGTAAPTVFALWTRGESYGAIRDFRLQAAIRMLQHIGGFQTQEE